MYGFILTEVSRADRRSSQMIRERPNLLELAGDCVQTRRAQRQVRACGLCLRFHSLGKGYGVPGFHLKAHQILHGRRHVKETEPHALLKWQRRRIHSELEPLAYGPC